MAMLLPMGQVLQAMQGEIIRLGEANAQGAVASAEQTVGVALNLLSTRASQGAAGVRAQFARLAAALESISGDPEAFRSEASGVERLHAQLTAVSSVNDLDELESSWRICLREFEALVARDIREERLSAVRHQSLISTLVDWEVGDLQGQLSGTQGKVQESTTIDGPKLEAYLRDRFDEPDLTVTSFRALPGGFGKETSLFEVQGRAISGGYVLRRDPVTPHVDNDCHRINHEFEVIRAVRERGFPAPEAVWCDLEHRLLPGGHFLVMRRAPGVAAGSVFAAHGSVPSDLSETLANILARLHALPELEELGVRTDSINPERARLSLSECTRQYVARWLEVYQGTDHLPSPATLSLFGWLLAHVPSNAGRPVLLHGDIGFHNFLFQEGQGTDVERQLSVVLDWEFAHLGDPAEDLAYVRNTLGNTLDWPQFLTHYREAGGAEISDDRIRFFEVWGHVRNAAGAGMVAAQLARGDMLELKGVLLPHLYVPMFLRAAQASIDRDVF